MRDKKQIEKHILQRARRCTHFTDNRYRWGEIKKILEEEKLELQDSDILEVGYVEGWDEGDSSRDPSYDLNVIRVREETDEEYEKYSQNQKKIEKSRTKRRYENYLRLKEEFGNYKE